MSDQTYNGWVNWETWNAVLWCDNEEVIYRARSCARLSSPRACEEFVRKWFPDGTPDMDDPGGLQRVNLQEVAEHWNSE